MISPKKVAEEEEVMLVLPGRNETKKPQLQMIDFESFAFKVNGDVSIRLYKDTRPHCLETATLQKGLVLVREGKELVEEGVGFGVPVVIYRDEPYFSSTALCSVKDYGKGKMLAKSFVMDTISRKRIGDAAYVNDGLYSVFHKVFHAVYVRNSLLSPFFNKLIELTKLFGMNTEFVKVKPRGTVDIKYKCLPEGIMVEASFNQLETVNCKEIVLLNEQGATYFRKYHDSDGQTLIDSQIGAWLPVTANEAALSNFQGTVSFSLTKLGGSVFFRGREKIRKRYSWVGLGYSLPPTTAGFTYGIMLKNDENHMNSRRE